MLSQFKNGLRCTPTLHHMMIRSRAGLHSLTLSAAERLISAARSYEILVIFGMRRSGNHLAINWILDQVDGAAVFYNNIKPNLPPYSARMTEFRLRLRNPSPRIVLSYEDVTTDQLLSFPLLSFLEDRIAQHSSKVRFALILRDPYNLFASRLQKWPERFADKSQVSAQKNLYVSHAKLAADPTPIWNNAPLIPILYNDLISSSAARAAIASQLGIRQGDRGLDQVPVYGHGSSFDGTGLSGDTVRGNVVNRWKAQEHNPDFQQIVGDPELQAIGQTLFAMSPPDRPEPLDNI